MKPQDILVLLKILLWDDGDWTIAKIAVSTNISISETHGAIKRCEHTGLLSTITRKPIRANLKEFLIHGLKYAFPAEIGAPDRGMPTAHSAPPLVELLTGGDDEVFIWPYAQGLVQGTSVAPLYKSAPAAAEKDGRLYELLTLIDAIRIGRARERQMAEKLLLERI